jgi:TolB-like protein
MMETTPAFGGVRRFGPFELNLATGELRKRGIRIGLQEQPLRVLAALLEAGGDVVSRNELCRRLWPEGTFVDFEHSLNAAIRRLRLTLGDQAGVPRFVETVHRRGYRFLALQPHASPASAALARGRARLAVMPFVLYGSASGDPAATAGVAFVDGLIDETITQLARTCPEHVGVIARSSVARAAEDEPGAADLGRMLGATYLVAGSVRRYGSRVRISAQLIESEEETHLWAMTYERIVTDPLAVQMEVAEGIAAAVAVALGLNRPAASGF